MKVLIYSPFNYLGEDPIAAHNRYPELWAKINREFVDEWKSTRVGKGRADPQKSSHKCEIYCK